MPRDRQVPQAPNAQAYGQKGDQLAAQAAMPLPQTNAAPMPRGMPTERAISPDAVAAAQAFDPGITPLGSPTSRPNEPITAGLSVGPGPGPEIFAQPGRAKRLAETLTMFARVSGDDAFLEMAHNVEGGAR